VVNFLFNVTIDRLERIGKAAHCGPGNAHVQDKGRLSKRRGVAWEKWRVCQRHVIHWAGGKQWGATTDLYQFVQPMNGLARVIHQVGLFRKLVRETRGSATPEGTTYVKQYENMLICIWFIVW